MGVMPTTPGPGHVLAERGSRIGEYACVRVDESATGSRLTQTDGSPAAEVRSQAPAAAAVGAAATGCLPMR